MTQVSLQTAFFSTGNVNQLFKFCLYQVSVVGFDRDVGDNACTLGESKAVKAAIVLMRSRLNVESIMCFIRLQRAFF